MLIRGEMLPSVGRDGAGLQVVSELTGVDATKWVWVLWKTNCQAKHSAMDLITTVRIS